MNTHSEHRVVIVGGGVAGLEIAASLGRRWRGRGKAGARAPSVILVDCDFAHVWKPMLHTIAAGTRTLETSGGVTVSGDTIGFAVLQNKQYRVQALG